MVCPRGRVGHAQTCVHIHNDSRTGTKPCIVLAKHCLRLVLRIEVWVTSSFEPDSLPAGEAARCRESGFLHRLRKPLLHSFCIVLNTMFNLRLPFQDNHTKLYKLSQQQSNRFGTDRAALKLPTRAAAKERTFPTKTTFACKSALANHCKSTKTSRP